MNPHARQRLRGEWDRDDTRRSLASALLSAAAGSLAALIRPIRPAGWLVIACSAAALGFYACGAHAQDASMLDERVTQQSVADTICRPGYADAVSPPFDELKTRKDRLLAARGIRADEGLNFALDRRVPVVLGGSPDAPANLDLLPWAGHEGERRKARAAVMLKHCVCAGKLTLAEAQTAIVGNWSAEYAGFGQTACGVNRLDIATGDRDNDHASEAGSAP